MNTTTMYIRSKLHILVEFTIQHCQIDELTQRP